MRHGIARGPGGDQAQNQQRNHCEKKNETERAKDALADAVAWNGNNRECCHESIVAD
jgi:hypothetical protein